MTKKKEESEIIEEEAIETEVIEAGEILSVSTPVVTEVKILQKIKDMVNLRGGK